MLNVKMQEFYDGNIKKVNELTLERAAVPNNRRSARLRGISAMGLSCSPSSVGGRRPSCAVSAAVKGRGTDSNP